MPEKIVRGIPSLGYDGLWCDLKGSALICHKSWFCVDDLTCCVRGIGRKYCFDRPLVPSTWLMHIGTNLIQFEVTTLEDAWFVMCEVHKCVLRTFFVNESTTPYNPHVDPEAWPKTCNNKPIWWTTMFKLLTQ